jgi:hypothetical protein
MNRDARCETRNTHHVLTWLPKSTGGKLWTRAADSFKNSY